MNLDRRSPTYAVAVAAVAAIGVSVGILVLLQPRLALSAALVALIVVLALTRPHLAVPVVIGYAALLGGVRRIVTFQLGDSLNVDPLVGVLPLAAVILAARAVRRGALRERTPLATVVLLLMFVAALGALTPGQGGLSVGLAGLVFFGAPWLWFWIGRTMVDERTLGVTYVTVLVLSMITALYGLAQTFAGFPAWDLIWAEAAGFSYGGDYRPFGLSASPDEYARILTVGLVVLAAVAVTRRTGRALTVLVISVPMLAALLYAGVRTSVVLLVVAVAAMFAVRRRRGMLTIAIGGLLALGALVLIAGRVATPAPDPSLRLETTLVNRQLDGLANPLDSTAELRIAILLNSLTQAIEHPLGRGTGAATAASERFTGDRVTGETDFADAALSWGVVGFGLTMAAYVLGWLAIVDVGRSRRSWVAMAAVGVMAVATLRWNNGALYPIAPLAWLTLGWADATRKHPAEPPSSVSAERSGRPTARG